MVDVFECLNILEYRGTFDYDIEISIVSNDNDNDYGTNVGMNYAFKLYSRFPMMLELWNIENDVE